ncbi:MAG: DUF11 domain-containing protein, partial [Rhodobacteraceae bacterium]|nr:DUF11 domain-containing protein [Paracoccaceae bacterium]
TLIPFEIELLEDGSPARNLSHTVAVQSSSPLELTVDPLSDPAAPGGTLVYELTYGNNGGNGATSTELRLPLPAGTTFVSATGGGTPAGNEVVWNLGSLAANGGGRQRVTVQVGAGLADSTLLVVDAATLSATVNFQARQGRALAVSRVDATAPLGLAMEINPDPAEPDELLDLQISVSNPNAGPTGTLTLRLLYPEHIWKSPSVTAGGDCPGTYCEAGEYLTWNLGDLPAYGGVSVSMNEYVLSGVVDGTLIPFEIELLEDGSPARNLSHTVAVQSSSPLELTVDPLSDPAAPGGT